MLKKDAKIYDWDMKIEKVEDYLKEYFTKDKIYKIRDGKIILDKDYDSSNKKFSLEDFLNDWDGEWVILRVKINDKWYAMEENN